MGRTRRIRKRKIVTDEVQDLIELKKWMKLKNCHLQMRRFPLTGRGLRSKRRICAGDELVSLPLRFLITPTTSCDFFHQINTSKLSPQLALTMFLMYESHLSETSAYWPYIKLLPNSYSTLFQCKKHEIDVLPCFMKVQVIKKKQELEEEFQRMVVMLSPWSCPHCGFKLENVFTVPLFHWAWFTVNTRSVYYNDDEYNGVALAPLLDMFNHSPEAEIEMIIDHNQKLYILKSKKNYKKKEEIFIKYGPHSNWKLLFEYGFILENNPHDYIEFTFEEVVNTAREYKTDFDAIPDSKYKFIKKNNFDKNLTKDRDEFSWNMNALLYVFITSDDNLPCIYAKCYSNEFSEDERNEIISLKKLLIKMKSENLTNYLRKMESVDEPSDAFSSAKKLLLIYLSFLV